MGWGQAISDQHVTGETYKSTFQVIKNELTPILINQNPFKSIHGKMNKKIFGVPSAKAALDIALYDLMGKVANQPLYCLIGGRPHEKLEIPQVVVSSPLKKWYKIRRNL